MALQLTLAPFQSGFRLINGDDLNNLVNRLNSIEPQLALNTATNTSGFTATGAQISGGLATTVLNLTGTLGAGANIQLPTASALVAALNANGIVPQANDSYELDIVNLSSANFAWTVTTNTGWTLNGTMTVAQNTMRRLFIQFTGIGSSLAVAATSMGQIIVG